MSLPRVYTVLKLDERSDPSSRSTTTSHQCSVYSTARLALDILATASYVAYEPLGAWIEVFRKAMVIAEADVSARILTELRAGRDLRLADLVSRRALSFGVTASLGADEDYAAGTSSRQPAIGAGFDGVRYRARHDPALRLTSVALFAPAGAPAPTDHTWPPGVSVPVPDELIEDAARTFGYRVLPAPEG